MYLNQTDGGNIEWIHVPLSMHRTGLTMHHLPRVKAGRSFPSHAYLCPPDVGNGSQELGHLERKPESLAALFTRAPDGYALGYGVCRVFSLLRLYPGWRVVYVGRYVGTRWGLG